MLNEIKIMLRGNEVSLEELKADVKAAYEKGYTNDKFAFTAETVEKLIDKIEELVNELIAKEIDESIKNGELNSIDE